jgi:hypothetical protein
LDQIALAMKKADFHHPGNTEIQVLPDAISLLPVIFEASQTDIVQLAGIRILDSLVSHWSDASPSDRSAIRNFVVQLHSDFSMDSAQHKRSHSTLVSIAVRCVRKRSGPFFAFGRLPLKN